MPIHDWTRVHAGTFHALHLAWIAQLQQSLNNGILPPNFYAMGEQKAGVVGPDVLTLQTRDAEETGGAEEPMPGTVAVAEAPPQAELVVEADTDSAFYLNRQRSLVIRHVSDDHVVAILEIVSPGNKHNQRTTEAFLQKVVGALQQGIHLLIVDIFPAGRWSPGGVHGLVWEDLTAGETTTTPDRPLILAAYRAGDPPTAYVNSVDVGDVLPDMPLFLTRDHYVNVPLEATYSTAYAGMPNRWRTVLEAE